MYSGLGTSIYNSLSNSRYGLQGSPSGWAGGVTSIGHWGLAGASSGWSLGDYLKGRESVHELRMRIFCFFLSGDHARRLSDIRELLTTFRND